MTLHPPLDPDPGSSRRYDPGAGHYGIDYNCWTGAPILCSSAGTVARIADESGGYGNLVTVAHADGFETRYAHLSEIHVTVGQDIPARHVLGLSGGAAGAPGAGNSTGPHLHYETRQHGAPIDPDTVLVPWSEAEPAPAPIPKGTDMLVVKNVHNGQWWLYPPLGAPPHEITELQALNYSYAGVPHGETEGPFIVELANEAAAARASLLAELAAITD